MKRKALIIYCGNTRSGKLTGPVRDAINYKAFLMSALGGHWDESEIGFLKDPTAETVNRAIKTFLNGADYTFIIFTGHGFIKVGTRKTQHVELADTCIPIKELITGARRQTMIIDACRGFYTPTRERIEKYAAISGIEHFEEASTRPIFDKAVQKAEEGLTILYAASPDESALDTSQGGAYLFSLLAFAETWKAYNKKAHILPLNVAHKGGVRLMYEKFNTIQRPLINTEKRLHHFPFAVMYPLNF